MNHQALPECRGPVSLGFAYQECSAPGGGFAAAYRALRQLRILDPIAGAQRPAKGLHHHSETATGIRRNPAGLEPGTR